MYGLDKKGRKEDQKTDEDRSEEDHRDGHGHFWPDGLTGSLSG